jgi:dolichol-phosphate mannosyltransferase
MKPLLSVVVPLYKEADNIKPLLSRLEPSLAAITSQYEILFCLDPSPDATEAIILEEIKRNKRIKLLLFSRRFGQAAATMAGILKCKGENCVVMDADLQDPPELIQSMFTKLQEGFEVVYATRKSRRGETWLKRFTSYMAYKVIAKLSEVEIPRNTGDFRIMSRRVIEELRGLHETHGFLKGLVAYVGFKQTCIEFDRDPRFSGEEKYGRFMGSIKVGLNGVVGFSSKPLQFMSIAGAIIAGFSFLLGLWFIIQRIYGINDLTPGLPTTVLVVSFFAGVQLLSLGLMGEYIGRIYDEVKRRPMYIIDKVIDTEGGVQDATTK